MIASAMNLFQLVLKQMKQRALSTWLTILSVLLGVALAISILILQREGASLFGQSDFGFDVLIGPKGSEMQLVLNTVYHLDASPGNIPYSVFKDLQTGGKLAPYVGLAVPIAVGDTYEGYPIIGTTPRMFNADDTGTPLTNANAKRFQYRRNKSYEIAQGRVFHAQKFEAILGADVARARQMKIGDTLNATHGTPRPGAKPDVHAETWTVVGIMAPTGTASDRAVYIPLISSYTIEDHGKALITQELIRKGMDGSIFGSMTLGQLREMESLKRQQEALVRGDDDHDDHDHDEHEDHDHDHDHGPKSYTLKPDGTIDLLVPETSWAISAILVQSASPALGQQLIYNVKNGQAATAVNPAGIMAKFFKDILIRSLGALWLISILVTLVAAISILVSIYNSIVGRMREIAILRALGATRQRIMLLICLEAGLIGLIGGLLGLVAGHLLAMAGSIAMDRLMGQGIAWHTVHWTELAYVGGVTVLCVIAGLVPAYKAYRSPVASQLVSQ